MKVDDARERMLRKIFNKNHRRKSIIDLNENSMRIYFKVIYLILNKKLI